MPDGPGDQKGIKVGDCITYVDGVSVSDLKSFFVIRGPIGSNVALRIKRGVPGCIELAKKLENGSEPVTTDVSGSEVSGQEADSDDSVDEITMILERKAVETNLVEKKSK